MLGMSSISAVLALGRVLCSMASTDAVSTYDPHFQSLCIQLQKRYVEELDSVWVDVDHSYNLYRETVKIDDFPLIECLDVFYLIDRRN